MPKSKLAVLGLGSRSTVYYLSELNRLYNQVKGEYSTCPLLLLNTDFNAINSLLPNTSNELDSAVNQYIHELETYNVAYLLIPNITLHETIDRLKVSKKILHPISLSIKKMKENEWDKVVLLGSYFSMTSTYIKNQLKANGIKVMLPTQEDMLFIDEVRKQVYYKTETEELVKKYHLIIQKYAQSAPVILGCTELSIVKPKRNKGVLDMADVQIEEAIKLVME